MWGIGSIFCPVVLVGAVCVPAEGTPRGRSRRLFPSSPGVGCGSRRRLVDELQQDYEVVTLDDATHGTRDRDTGAFVPWRDVAGGGFDWLRARGFLGG